MAKVYVIRKPTGEEVEVKKKDLNSFCIDNELDRTHLHKTKYSKENGGREHHKGFKILEEKKEVILVDNVENTEDTELLFKEIQKLKKSKQRLMDNLRIERKNNRLNNRIESIVDEFHKEVISNLKKYKPSKNIKNIKDNKEKEAVLHCGDWHINELVDMASNQFNIKIAEERVNKLISRTIQKLHADNISNITIITTGDMINLSGVKHFDKLMNNQVTRAEALMHAFRIMSSVIDLLLNEGFNVSIASCNGNEGRSNELQNFSNVDRLSLDNYDFLLFSMIQSRYFGTVNCLNNGDKIEDIITVNGKNIIILHGDKINHNKLEDAFIKKARKFYKSHNKMADCMILGHIHSPLLTGNIFRTASLVGANSYSEVGLNIPDSYASQNLLIIGDEIEATAIKLN